MTGEVLLDGEDVLTMQPGRLRAVRWDDMSIVFQGALHSLNPVHTVERQIAEAIEIHRPSIGSRELHQRVAGAARGRRPARAAVRATTRISSRAASGSAS